jgi:ribonuclease HI
MDWVHREAQEHFKSLFLEKIEEAAPRISLTVTAYFDGMRNPYGSGYGWVINDGLKKYKGCGALGPGMTNNIAEAAGLIAVMRELIRRGLNGRDITIYGDSRIVIDRINRDSMEGCKGAYTPYAAQALEIKKGFVNVSFRWIPRELNREADIQSKHSKQLFRPVV